MSAVDWQQRAMTAEAELKRITQLLDTPAQDDFLAAAVAALANWHAAAITRGEVMPEERGDQADHAGRI